MRKNRYQTTSERHAELFDQRDGEDVYEMISRQIDMATPRELVQLALVRTDDKQLRAMELSQLAKTLQWTRRAVFASVAGSVLATFVAMLALLA